MTKSSSSYGWTCADAVKIASQLLCYELIHHSPDGDVGGIIVETEAYRARDDASSHAFGRLPTARTAPMFAAGGTIYVYFTYGMHYCLNISTGPANEAQAVLIRALEPTVGLELMRPRRPADTPDHRLLSGPANLTRSMGIDKSLSGTRLGAAIDLRPPHQPITSDRVSSGPRIGIKQAIDLPWRFWITDHPSVSK